MSEYQMQPGGSMAWQHTNVWVAGRLLATYEQNTTTVNGVTTPGSLLHFYLDDPLGTRRVQADYAGNLEQTCSSLPYGDSESCGTTPTEHLFTGKERDGRVAHISHPAQKPIWGAPGLPVSETWVECSRRHHAPLTHP